MGGIKSYSTSDDEVVLEVPLVWGSTCKVSRVALSTLALAKNPELKMPDERLLFCWGSYNWQTWAYDNMMGVCLNMFWCMVWVQH